MKNVVVAGLVPVLAAGEYPALHPPWIEKRTDGADTETAVLRPHLSGWLAWVPAVHAKHGSAMTRA